MRESLAFAWLISFLDSIDYFNRYPSRQYLQELINDPGKRVTEKIKWITGDSLVQKYLYGDVLSSIDAHADPVDYFYKHTRL